MKKAICLLVVLCLALPFAAFGEALDPVAETKTLIEALFAGDAQTVFDRLTPEMQQAAPLAMLEGLPEMLAAQCGAFTGFSDEAAQGNAAVMRILMEKMNLLAQFMYNEEGKIALFSITIDPTLPKEEAPLADNEEAVAVGPLALPGILTLPKEGDKFPAVVLVHGSGPNDRNETLGATAIFRDIAEGLSAQGIAVLRYDKRTYLMQQGKLAVTQEELQNLTMYDETVIDAVAAVEMLRADPRIDPDRVFVIGHSQGAILATTIDAEANAAGLILMAGTLRTLTDVLADQLEAAAPELDAADIETARTLPGKTEEEARALTLLGNPAYSFWEQAQHDLTALAEASDAPMLILQGELDTQIYLDRDYPLWEQFAAAHPDKDITLKVYEGLGHAFVPADGAVLSRDVLADIAAWILDR